MNAAEQAIMDKWRSGQPITALDHAATLETQAELDGFRDALKAAGRLTPELVTALLRQEVRIRASHSR